MTTALDLSLTVATGRWCTVVARRSGRSGLARSTSVWVPPGTTEARLLFPDVETARSRVWWALRGLPFGPADLAPGRGPALAWVDVGDLVVVDAINDGGLLAADLPTTFPYLADGARVPGSRCRAVTARAHAMRTDGIVARSWTGSSGVELVYFPRERQVRFREAPEPFERWFWGLRSGTP